jgi:hypothetical protein
VDWWQAHAEFTRWQSTVPSLYDMCMSYGLTWPSLSAQWLPTEPERSNGQATHQMLVGTYTNGGCESTSRTQAQTATPTPHTDASASFDRSALTLALSVAVACAALLTAVPNYIQLAHVSIPDKDNWDPMQGSRACHTELSSAREL